MRGIAFCAIALFSVVLSAQSHSARPEPGAAENVPFAITTGPFLQQQSGDSVGVLWTTSRNADGVVEFSCGSSPAQRLFASQHGLVDANSRVHRVTVPMPKAGTRCTYRAISREILKFEPYKVTFGQTAASVEHPLFGARRDISMAVLNDIHEHFDLFPKLLSASGGKFDVVALNGDMFSALQRESQLLALLAAASDSFAAESPTVFVRGNHETRGAFARELPTYLSQSDARFYYSFNAGPVHFVVLDTGEDKVDSHWAYSGLADFDSYRSEQAEWLKQDVRSAAFLKAKYRVVLAHMDFPFATGSPDEHGVNDALAKFGPVLDKAGIDLFVTAHAHKWSISKPDAARKYCVIRGGGPESPTLIHVAAGEKTLNADLLDSKGELLGSCAAPPRN